MTVLISVNAKIPDGDCDLAVQRANGMRHIFHAEAVTFDLPNTTWAQFEAWCAEQDALLTAAEEAELAAPDTES